MEKRVAEPPFTLHTDKPGLTNMGREYVNDADPSGYTTSKRFFGDYGYWKYLQRVDWFRTAVATWDEELEAKLYAEGLSKIRELATGDDSKALQAAKYLADKNFSKKGGSVKRGRPSKEEIEGKTVELANEKAALASDLARITLVK